MKKLLLSLMIASTSVVSAFAQNWQLVWQDEFTNGISGDWVFETGGGGWGNNELQYYRRENASVQNGQLVITAKREAFGGYNYTSTRMKTQGKKSWKYGKMEARIAMPAFQGIWPAFWMLGDNISSVGWPACGEIDVMEHVNGENRAYGTMHWRDHNNAYANYGGSIATSVTQYHIYTVEWDASMIRWFVDGVKYHEASIANGVNGTSEFHNNFFILLNMAVGGNWPGFAVDNNAFPANMYVDYVRVYQSGGTNPPPPTGVATVYKDCNYAGYAIGLPVGNYVYGDLYARGVGNEDISSLRVNSGYEVVLYEHDNFTGASVVVGTNSCLVGNGWNDRTTSLRVRAVSNSFSRTIEAENYSAMLGVQTEACSEGGQNVGYIEAGDWMAYNSINFPSSGSYLVEYRVASVSGSRLSLDLNAGAIQLGAVNIPATGGWQNWTTVSHTVNVGAGTYNLGIFAQASGWNINWIRITKVNGAKIAADESTEDITTDYSALNALEVSPNPADHEIAFTSSYDLSYASIRILDMMGNEVYYSPTCGTVNVSAFAAGVYTIQIVLPDETTVTRRFIKK